MASEATKINIIDDTSLNQAIIQLKSKFDLDISLITLSDKGVAVYDDEFRIHPTFTREVFDRTYPGYGSSYPDYLGGIGILFEQASSRGQNSEKYLACNSKRAKLIKVSRGQVREGNTKKSLSHALPRGQNW